MSADQTTPGVGSISAEEPLSLNLADDGELLREFINESREHLDNIEQGVLVLEGQPNDSETLNTIFRAFHTFKGSAGFLNLTPVNRLAHVLESLLDQARQSRLCIGPAVIDLILRGRDLLKRFIDEIEAQLNGSREIAPIMIPTETLRGEVLGMIEQESAGVPSSPAAIQLGSSAEREAPTVIPDTVPYSGNILSNLASAPEPLSFAVGRPVVPGEDLQSQAIQTISQAAAVSGDDGKELETQVATPNRSNVSVSIVKVDTSKLDSLLDLVGEMVIAQSLVAQDLSQLTEAGEQFSRNMAHLGRITKDLQRVSMSLRMVPIRNVFQKMARVARDLGAKQNKKVRFLTEGEETELDRGVVEELNDPLLHMIRNSMDHGIEPPERRAAAGKSAEGTLNLRAYHQGGNIIVEIEDDGAGLNRERILAKAVERGLTSPNASHTDEEVFNFIFEAGFSTAEKITDLSGRGVGLDVVRRNIERLRGTVSISSTPGRGTLFKITLPLTLAIIDGLIVRVGDERFIMPALSVRESFRPAPGVVSKVSGGAEVVNVRGRLLPLLRLHECFALKNSCTDPLNGIIVVVQSGAKLRCLLVDALLHKQEVVIKNLNGLAGHKNRSLAGAAILGDGKVGLILDINALVHEEAAPLPKAA